MTEYNHAEWREIVVVLSDKSPKSCTITHVDPDAGAISVVKR